MLAGVLFFISSNDPDNFTGEEVFGLISLFTLMAFVFYYFVIQNEKKNHTSKLNMMRLDIYLYALILQVIIIFAFVSSAVLLLLKVAPNKIIEFAMFLLAEIFAYITAYMFYAVLNISSFLRKLYVLSSDRFQSFHGKV